MTSVKRGEKKANEMNLRDGYQTRVDNEHMHNTQAKYALFQFSDGSNQCTLNLPQAQFHEEIWVQFERTSEFPDVVIGYGNAKSKLVEA